MKQFRLLTLLALLMTAATGAWAQSATTHVVTQATVNNIFSGDGYTLGDAVKVGDVLDFQGTIELEGDASHSLVINKQVNIISSTKDAVIKLHTVEGSLLGDDPGSSFVINKAGSGTTVQDIRIENTETWLYNTSNVTFTGVTMWVEEARVGSGVGHVALRYSDHITFDGCTVYTKNNGGSSPCVLTGSHDCTFKDTRFEAAGNVGNPLYLGNPYNTNDMPAGYTMNNDNISVINCTLTAESSGAMSQFQMNGGLRHRIEGCTIVNMNVSSGFGATLPNSANEGHTILNNTITGGNLNVLNYCTAEGNTVTGNVTVQKGTTVTNNDIFGNVTVSVNSSGSDYIGSTITGNSILGKVTFNSNSKNNTFTGNTVISSEAYAVVMAPTADANNTVTDNILLAASNAGDAAVNPSTGTGNTITGNLSEAAAGDATWNFDAATGTLTIGGTGAMADYEQTSDGQTTAPWAFLSDKMTRVVIGEGVTKVGSNAFQGCTALNDVFVKGAGTLTIGTAAFDAAKTPAIYVPTGTEAAYQTAWSAYASSIGEYMNCGADAMAVYDAASHTLTICGKGAMTDFASAADQPWKALQGEVQTVSFEPFITAIGANAFSGCSALTAANIEGTATTIADGAFDGNATGRRIFVPAQAIAGYGESTYAADIYSAGQCGAEGSDVSWELSAQTMALAISGTGAMADYAKTSDAPWNSVRAKITSATIAEGVTSVSSYAFCDCSSLTNVTIPDGVTSIGNYAFYYCSSMTAINLPAGLTSIGRRAFYYCSSMTNVTIPDGVTTIGDDAFHGCVKLESITLPAGLTSISDFAFYGCDALTAINIPATVTTIGGSAFRNCSKLESITLPDGVTSVGNYAFRNCSMLTEINIFAPSLQTYGYNAFQNTPADLKIYVPAISLEEYKTKWSAYADKFVALPYYALTMKEGTLDADKWTVKVGEAEKTVTLPITNVKKGETVTVTYTGSKKVIGVKAEKKAATTYTLLSAATTSDCGKVVCAAGHLHDAKTAVPDGCTAVGILGKVTETGHGLILALKDAPQQTWNTIDGWTSASYAGTTLKVLPDDAARGTNLTSYTTLGETTVSNWAVAQQSDYDAIFTNLGSMTGDSMGKTYDGNVNAFITTGVGGTEISGNYWSPTEDGVIGAWSFNSVFWSRSGKSNSNSVRPVLGF